MSITKQIKDYFIKVWLGNDVVPSGLAELHQYFRMNGPINFEHKKQDDGSFVAISTNFRHGSIITHAKNLDELDNNVKDAILTAFEVPSSYAAEAGIHRVGKEEYAFA